MRPVENWKEVLKKAWSLRLIALAGILTGLEAMMGVLPSEWTLWLPEWVWPTTITVITAAAFASRLIAQDSLKK